MRSIAMHMMVVVVAVLGAALAFIVGVAAAPGGGDAPVTQRPMTTAPKVRRICAELCMSGLGGEPCGPNCVDILPQGVPRVHSGGGGGGGDAADASDAADAFIPDNVTRRDACPLLCSNRLGYPLCQCLTRFNTVPVIPNPYNADFLQVCAFFCHRYKHRVYGCEPCESYERNEPINGDEVDFYGVAKSLSELNGNIDWNAWCKQQCANGEGGAACNCDMLPMMLKDFPDVSTFREHEPRVDEGF